MAIEHVDIRTILRALVGDKAVSAAKSAKATSPAGPRRLLILGDAAVYFTGDELVKIATEEGFRSMTKVGAGKLDVQDLGRFLGFETTETLDVNGRADILFDLGQPVPSEWHSKYSMIIDAGVLFWCFDPAQVLKNIYSLLSPNGVVVHITALTGHISRGYYNPHPRLFEDFYLGNGAEFLIASYRCNFGRGGWRRWLKKILGGKNIPTFYTKPGQVYPNSVCLNKITFSDQPVVDLLFLPTDVVSTSCFIRRGAEPVRVPRLSG